MEMTTDSNSFCDQYFNINSVPIRVIQLGPKQSFINNNNIANDPIIVVMISGNPGEIGYYYDFMSLINRSTNLLVIGLSHAGHNIPHKHLNIPSVSERPELYTLCAQINNKIDFINKYISSQSKLILIGHSIGCYIILEMLNKCEKIASKTLHSIMIFPAIESIGSTSEGRKYSFLFKWLKYPLLCLSYCLQYLSDDLKEKIISFAIQANNGIEKVCAPECAVKSATNLFYPNCLRALIHMSLIEFQTVENMNRRAIDCNKDRLTFLYGEQDKWCPIEFYHRISGLYPDVDIRLSLKDINHAFVLNSGSTVQIAQMVDQIIVSLTKKYKEI